VVGNELRAVLSNISLNLEISDPTISSDPAWPDRIYVSGEMVKEAERQRGRPVTETERERERERGGGKGGKIKGIEVLFFRRRLFPLKIPKRKIESEKSLGGFIRPALILRRGHRKRNAIVRKQVGCLGEGSRISFTPARSAIPGVFSPARPSLRRFVTCAVTLLVKTRSRNRRARLFGEGREERCTVSMQISRDGLEQILRSLRGEKWRVHVDKSAACFMPRVLVDMLARAKDDGRASFVKGRKSVIEALDRSSNRRDASYFCLRPSCSERSRPICRRKSFSSRRGPFMASSVMDVPFFGTRAGFPRAGDNRAAGKKDETNVKRIERAVGKREERERMWK